MGQSYDGIPGHTTKDRENRRIPFNPEGRLVEILERRKSLGPNAYVFGSECGEYQPNIQTAWDALRLHADGVDIRIIQLMLGHASLQQTQR